MIYFSSFFFFFFFLTYSYIFSFFFFQAEDGIRDPLVTGVQTCALPISCRSPRSPSDEADRESSVVASQVASRDRESVVEGKSVDLGGRRIIKEKKKSNAQTGGRRNNKKNHQLCRRR